MVSAARGCSVIVGGLVHASGDMEVAERHPHERCRGDTAAPAHALSRGRRQLHRGAGRGTPASSRRRSILRARGLRSCCRTSISIPRSAAAGRTRISRSWWRI